MIYTIGHSTRTQNEVFEMLAENEVDELIDVRSYPSSRYCPQWNQIEIVNSVCRGIGYEWMQGLGGRRKALPLDQSINGAWDKASFRGYADYMQTVEFATALLDLASSADGRNVAIMCSEAVWWKCHRSMIADALVAKGITVTHIMGSGTEHNVKHKLRDFAMVRDYGRVSYPAQLGG